MPLQIAAWIVGLTVLYGSFRLACWMHDRETAAWAAAVDAHADKVTAAALLPEDLSFLDRADGVGGGR
jgi:hypothetical protein